VDALGRRRAATPASYEIGYWIRAECAGQGFGTESTAALRRAAFELTDIERIEIRVDPANEASSAIPRKLGCASPAAAAALEAYDAADKRVL
jgi:RimJ/RimL family protein N-acetyltransferase